MYTVRKRSSRTLLKLLFGYVCKQPSPTIIHGQLGMAKSRFEYVRTFELPDPLIQGTFIVVRIDGRGFHKYASIYHPSRSSRFLTMDRFSDTHAFEKPNDVRALELMDKAATTVMQEYKDVVLAFGESDEYRYVMSPHFVVSDTNETAF